MCITLFIVWISEIQRKSFTDVLQNRCSKKFCSVYRKALVLESFFNKHADLKACNFIKRRLQHRYLPVKSAKFIRTPFFPEHTVVCFWNYLINSLFIAFENNGWCHFVVCIGTPVLISFYCVCFASFYFFLFFLFFLWILLPFDFEVTLSILKIK